MTPLDASTIKAGTRALNEAAKPNVTALVFAIIGLGGCALLVWRDEVRADAQIRVMEKMADRIGALDRDFREAGIKVARRKTTEIDE